MKRYDFIVVLAELIESIDDAEKLAERCEDGTVSSSCGVSQIDFHREGESLDAAIRSAIADIERCGFHAARVETEESQLLDAINSELCVAP